MHVLYILVDNKLAHNMQDIAMYGVKYLHALTITDLEDFDNTEKHARFYSSEDGRFGFDCLPVRIEITDDDINEAEQMFVIQLSLVTVPFGIQNLDMITLSRNVSLGRIIDNDRELHFSTHFN